MSNMQRLLLIVGALVVLVVGLVLASPGGDDGDKNATSTTPAVAATDAPPGATTTTPPAATATTPAPGATTIQIAGGKPAGGVQAINAKKGDTVRIEVTSTDTTSEVHLHGYDIKRDLKAGGKVTFSFKASAEGIFEMELEETATQIAKITIEP
jgi:FtsP/CotA-like multicopper oxidase with cupredoxin domain